MDLVLPSWLPPAHCIVQVSRNSSDVMWMLTWLKHHLACMVGRSMTGSKSSSPWFLQKCYESPKISMTSGCSQKFSAVGSEASSTTAYPSGEAMAISPRPKPSSQLESMDSGGLSSMLSWASTSVKQVWIGLLSLTLTASAVGLPFLLCLYILECSECCSLSQSSVFLWFI